MTVGAGAAALAKQLLGGMGLGGAAAQLPPLPATRQGPAAPATEGKAVPAVPAVMPPPEAYGAAVATGRGSATAQGAAEAKEVEAAIRAVDSAILADRLADNQRLVDQLACSLSGAAAAAGGGAADGGAAAAAAAANGSAAEGGAGPKGLPPLPPLGLSPEEMSARMREMMSSMRSGGPSLKLVPLDDKAAKR